MGRGTVTANLARGGWPDPAGEDIAARVGVRQPHRIRYFYVPGIPMPADPLLVAAASQTGLIGPHIAGMTLGHSIFFREDTQVGPRLLSHECRHVFQYEAYGSIAAFLTEYLRQVVMEGYRNAPPEIDARERELQE